MSIGVMVSMSAPRYVLGDPTNPTVRFVLGVGLILASRYGSCTSLHPLTLCMSFTGSPTSDPVCPHIALSVAVMSSDSDSLSCYQFCISWLLPVLVQCPPLHYHWCIAILLVGAGWNWVFWTDSLLLLPSWGCPMLLTQPSDSSYWVSASLTFIVVPRPRAVLSCVGTSVSSLWSWGGSCCAGFFLKPYNATTIVPKLVVPVGSI